jgi:hypothetical protein
MHGMLSAAILVLVFVLVAAASGGSVVWLFRAASVDPGYSRSPRQAPATPVADTVVDLPAPQLAIDHLEGHVLALPPAAEPRELEAPPVDDDAVPDDEPSGAQIYVLDSSRRSGR